MKVKKLYLENGYLNMEYLANLGVPFVYVVGGRGTGKTYGGLKYVKENDIKFMFMRRTQAQADIVAKEELSPWKKLNKQEGYNVVTRPVSKYIGAFYDGEVMDGKNVATGEPIGYSCAMSTLSNVRGFDASDVEIFIYDEFIPEKHERKINGEANAFFNAYETINRNRELEGLKAVVVLAFSNSNDLANPIFLELGFVRIAEKMRERNQELYVNKEKKYALVILKESEISEQKRETVLYQMTKGTEFASMSLDNDFAGEERGRIKSRNLIEYIPVVAIGEICVYRHKSKNVYYVSSHLTGTPPKFRTGDMDRERFRRAYIWLWREYLFNNIEFEEYLCEILLTKYFN